MSVRLCSAPWRLACRRPGRVTHACVQHIAILRLLLPGKGHSQQEREKNTYLENIQECPCRRWSVRKLDTTIELVHHGTEGDTILAGPLAPDDRDHHQADNKPVKSGEIASTPGLQIHIADISVAEDAHLVGSLTRIVNDAYGEVEADIFLPGYRRTDEAEIVNLIQEGCLAIAYLPACESLTSDTTDSVPLPKTPSFKPVGCVFVKQLSARLGNFGMLALELTYRGGGLGRAMIDFAEKHCRENGCTVMQMELLMPTSFEHAVKPKMQAWYQRMGYRMVKLRSFNEDYPSLATQLAGPADYKVFEKALV